MVKTFKKLNKIKQIPTLHLTTQVKHIFYNDAEILLNPKIKDFYEEKNFYNVMN